MGVWSKGSTGGAAEMAAVGSELERRLASRRQRRWWRRWAALPFCASAVPRRAPPATMLSHRGFMAAPGQEWDAERRPPPNRPAIPVIMPLPRGQNLKSDRTLLPPCAGTMSTYTSADMSWNRNSSRVSQVRPATRASPRPAPRSLAARGHAHPFYFLPSTNMMVQDPPLLLTSRVTRAHCAAAVATLTTPAPPLSPPVTRT